MVLSQPPGSASAAAYVGGPMELDEGNVEKVAVSCDSDVVTVSLVFKRGFARLGLMGGHVVVRLEGVRDLAGNLAVTNVLRASETETSVAGVVEVAYRVADADFGLMWLEARGLAVPGAVASTAQTVAAALAAKLSLFSVGGSGGAGAWVPEQLVVTRVGWTTGGVAYVDVLGKPGLDADPVGTWTNLTTLGRGSTLSVTGFWTWSPPRPRRGWCGCNRNTR